MKIAILGWGSLIWDPKNLEINKTLGENGWFDDGPLLPVEFARISKDGRLTLVIVPGEKEVKTLYSISRFIELEHAILDLAVREGCSKNQIGYFSKKNNKFYPIDFKCNTEIMCWMNKNVDIEAVIWTNLEKKLWYMNDSKEKIIVEETEIIHYLRNLTPEKHTVAEQYIRRTPENIHTAQLENIELELKWFKIKLPK